MKGVPAIVTVEGSRIQCEVAPPGSIDGVKGVPTIVTVVASCNDRFMDYPASTKAVNLNWPALKCS